MGRPIVAGTARPGNRRLDRQPHPPAAAGGSPLPTLAWTLKGIDLNDPIGPQPVDTTTSPTGTTPTSTTTTTTTPTTAPTLYYWELYGYYAFASPTDACSTPWWF
ncbi:MAG TPA: hypothetical protein VFA26_06225 [Gemmataceae bacterium]|nr:hypothetical protein [Gemmataceae bacterium]